MTENLSVPDLARRIVLRHRGEGHLRFDLPDPLCTPTAAGALETHLRELAGVYRVTVFRGAGKLSIFFDRHACTVHDIVRRLHGGLATCAEASAIPPATSPSVSQPVAKARRPWAWVKQKGAQAKARFRDAKAKAQLLLYLARMQTEQQPMLAGAFTEKAAINFFNDILVFYLIKVHWDMISQQWLKQPLKYRNAWLSTFYLVFLLVRFRKQKNP